MNPRAQWIRLSPSLIVSQCQRYILSYWLGDWFVAAWNGAGWVLLGVNPCDTLRGAKARVNRHLFTRPLPREIA
jgi:hypothetical protein